MIAVGKCPENPSKKVTKNSNNHSSNGSSKLKGWNIFEQKVARDFSELIYSWNEI